MSDSNLCNPLQSKSDKSGFGVNVEDIRSVYLNVNEPYFLEENLVSKEPFGIFDCWFKQVVSKSNLSYEEVNAVCLCTSSVSGKPASRMVLMKEYDRNGFCFYSHYNSRKGKEIIENPFASMLFYWPKVNRQVRIEGILERLPIEKAEEYWMKRPLKSRIGSKLSDQSKVVPNRKYLDEKRRELEALTETQGEVAIKRPEDWGGYRLVPKYFEFWQGQSDRIHDRICFEKKGGPWVMHRLSP